MVELIQSKDPEEIQQGIDLARTTRHWQSWIQKAIPFSWSDEFCSSSSVQITTFLRAGAMAPRFSEKFIPITFMAWQRFAPHAVDRELLSTLLSAGASINDTDPFGRSLLDQIIRFCVCDETSPSGNKFVVEDFDYLMELGAIPTRKTVAMLYKIDDERAIFRAKQIEAEWNREQLTQILIFLQCSV